MNRKRRFLYGLVFVIFIYGLLLVELAVARVFVWLLVVSAAFVFSVYMVNQKRQTKVSDGVA